MTKPSDEEVRLAEKARAEHGAIAHRAAFADLALYEVFHHYVSACGRTTSRAIYFTIDSAKGRQALVKRTVEAQGVDSSTRALIDALGQAVSKAITHRNDTAHSFFEIEIDNLGFDDKLKVVNPKKAFPSSRVTDASLALQRDASIQHLRKVQAAFEAVCLKLGIPPTVTL